MSKLENPSRGFELLKEACDWFVANGDKKMAWEIQAILPRKTKTSLMEEMIAKIKAKDQREIPLDEALRLYKSFLDDKLRVYDESSGQFTGGFYSISYEYGTRIVTFDFEGNGTMVAASSENR